MSIQIHKVQYNPNELGLGWTGFFSGLPKCGKTTGANTFPNPLIIDFEQGTDYIDGANVIQVNSLRPILRPKLDKDGKHLTSNGKPIYEVVPPIERGLVWRTGPNVGSKRESYSVQEVLAYLEKNPTDYTTIVLDPIDVLYDWCERETLQELKINAMGELSYGADWALARNKCVTVIDQFINFAKTNSKILLLICHQKQVSQINNKEIIQPNLPSGLVPILAGKSELIGHIFNQKNSKVSMVNFGGNEFKVTGSRFRALAGVTIEWNYNRIKEYVTNFKEE